MKGLRPQLVFKQARRKATILQLGGKCMDCGSAEHLNIHHKWGRSSDNLLTNLRLLCYSCHRKRHRSKVLSGEWQKKLQKIQERIDTDPKFRLKLQRAKLEYQTQEKLEDFI